LYLTKPFAANKKKPAARVVVFLLVVSLFLSSFYHPLFTVRALAQEAPGEGGFEQGFYQASLFEYQQELEEDGYPFSGSTLPENGYNSGENRENEEPSARPILPRGNVGNVVGHVHDIGGNGISGATVSIIRLDGAGSTQTTTSQPVDGAFSFTGLPLGVYTIIVSVADHFPRQQTVNVGPGDNNVTIVLSATTFDRFLAVRVLAAGVNSSDITVTFNGTPLPLDDEVWGTALTVAGSTGTLEVTLPGPIVITRPITSADYDPVSGVAFIVVDTGLGGGAAPPGMVRGVVRSSDAPNDPIDGAAVSLVNHDTFGWTGVITGPDGTFAFPNTPQGKYLLVVTADGFNAAIVEPISIIDNQPGITEDIYLDPGLYSQALLVLPQATDPTAPGATTVELEGDSLTRVEEIWFIFLQEHAGDRTIAVTAPGYLDASQMVTPASFANNKAFFEIPLTLNTALAPGVVQGVVRDEGGLPLPGANVALVNTANAARMDTVTDPQGQYTFTGVPAGVYRLAFAAGGRNAAVSANAVTIVASSPGHHQTDQTLLPGPNERVLLAHLDGLAGNNQNPLGTVVILAGRHLTAPAIASSDNFWRLFSPIESGAPGGIGQIDASAPNYIGEDEVLLSDYTGYNNIAVVSVEMEWTDVDIGITPPRVVRGIVRYASGINQPLQNVGVTLFDINTGFRMDTRTNASGFYEFVDVPDGDYMLVFTAVNALRPGLANLNSAPIRTPASFSINAAAGHRHDQNISHQLSPQTRYLIAFARDPGDNVVTGTTVHLGVTFNPHPLTSRLEGQFFSSTRLSTDIPNAGSSLANNVQSVGTLTANTPGSLGPNWLAVTPDDYNGTGSDDFNGVAIVHLPLTPDIPAPAPGAVEGFLWDPFGPIAGSNVVLLDVYTGTTIYVPTNAEGFFRFSGVPHGQYHLLFGLGTPHTPRISGLITLDASTTGHRLDHILPVSTSAEQGYVFARFFDADGNRITANTNSITQGPASSIIGFSGANLAVPGIANAGSVNQVGPVHMWWTSVTNTTTVQNSASGSLFTGVIGSGVNEQLQRGYHFVTGADFDSNNIAVIDIVAAPPASGVVTGYVHNSVNNNVLGDRSAVIVNLDTADVQRTVVNPDGSYTFSGLAPGHYRLVLTGTNRALHMAPAFEITPGGPGFRRDHQFTNLNQNTGVAMFVHVVDEDGNNLAPYVTSVVSDNGAGANVSNFVRPTRLAGNPSQPDIWHRTTARNDTTLIQMQRVTAQAPGFFATSVSATLAANFAGVNEVALITIEMEEDDRNFTGNIIHGQVTIAGGIPVYRALVTVFDMATGDIFANVLTDSDGSYIVPNVPNGEYRVLFTSDNTATRRADLRAPIYRAGIMHSEPVVMTGGPIERDQVMTTLTNQQAALMVRVQDQSGNPVPGANVMIHSPGTWANTSGTHAHAATRNITPLPGQTGDTRYWFRIGNYGDGSTGQAVGIANVLTGMLMVEAPGFARGFYELRNASYYNGPYVVTIVMEPQPTRPERTVYGYFRAMNSANLQNPAVVLLNVLTGERWDYTVNVVGGERSFSFDNVADGTYRLVFVGDRVGNTRTPYQSPIFTIGGSNLRHRYDRFSGQYTAANVNSNARLINVILVDEHDIPLPNQTPAGLQVSWAPNHATASPPLLTSPGANPGLWHTFSARSAALVPGRLTVGLPQAAGYLPHTELIYFADPRWINDVAVIRVHLQQDFSPAQPPGTVYGRVTHPGTAQGLGSMNIHLINLDATLTDREDYWRILQTDLVVGSAPGGGFVFENVPPGRYRLVMTGTSRTTQLDTPPFTITASGPGSTHRQDFSPSAAASPAIPLFYRLQGDGVTSQRHPSPPGMVNFGTRISSTTSTVNNPLPAVGATDSLWYSSSRPTAASWPIRVWKPGFEIAYYENTAQNIADDRRFGVEIATITLTPEITPPPGTIRGQMRDTSNPTGTGAWNPESGGGQWTAAAQWITLVNMDPNLPLDSPNARRDTTVSSYGQFTFENVPNGTWRLVVPNAQLPGTAQAQHPNALANPGGGRVSAPIVVNNDGHTVHFDNTTSSNQRMLLVRLHGMGAHGQHPPGTMITMGMATGNVGNVVPINLHSPGEGFFWHLGRGTQVNIHGGVGPLFAVSPGFRVAESATTEVFATDYVQGVALITLPMVAQDAAGAGIVQGHVRQSPGGVGSAVNPFNGTNAQAVLVNVATGQVAVTGNAPHGWVPIDPVTGFYQFTGVPNGTYRVVFTAGNRHARISTAFAISNNGIVMDENFMDSTNLAVGTAQSRVVFAHLSGIGVDIQDLPGAQLQLRNTAGTLTSNFTAPGVNDLWQVRAVSGGAAPGFAPVANNPAHGTGDFTATAPGYHDFGGVTLTPADFTADSPGGIFVHSIPVPLEMDITTAPPQTVRGFVRAFESPNPPLLASVALINTETGERRNASTDPNGFFQFRSVTPGTYRLAFTATARTAHFSHYFEVTATTGYHYDINLRTPPANDARLLFVRVISPYFTQDAPPPGLQVTLGTGVGSVPLNPPGANGFWYLARGTGPGVPGGLGLLSASAPGFETESVTLTEGSYFHNVAIITLNMVHERDPGTIRGFVRSGTPILSTPLPNATVTAINQQTFAAASAQSNSAGFYQIAGRPPGTYSLFASAPGHNTRMISGVVVPEGGYAEQDIYLQSGDHGTVLYAVAVGATPTSVVASDGRPLTWNPVLEVWYLTNAAPSLTVTATASGFGLLGSPVGIIQEIWDDHGVLFVIMEFAPTAQVTFRGNGGTTTHGLPSSSPGVAQVTLEVFVGDIIGAANAPVFTRADHRFASWNDEQDGSGAAFDPATAVITGNMIVYAQWDHTVIVRFMGNGGTTTHGVTGGDPPVTYVDIPVIIGDALGVANLPVFTHDNAAFSHWNLEQTALPGTLFDPTQNLHSDITVYARWDVTVIFVGNGGQNVADDAATATVTIPMGNTVNPIPIFTRRGHHFDGWNTEQDGTGNTFDTTTAVPGNMNVYAQWDPMDDDERFGGLNFIDHPDNINYGTVVMDFTTTRSWRLGPTSALDVAPGATPIEDVYFTIGNPHGATGWQVWARAEPNAAGLNLAPLLWAGSNSINQIGAPVYDYLGNGAPLTHTIQWSGMRTANRDVRVQEVPGSVISSTYSAYLHWTFVQA